MFPSSSIIKLQSLLAGILLGSCLLPAAQTARAQTRSEAPAAGSQDQTEVLRVYTQLVQTDVMVFDRQGNFVHGLKPENFQLRIDGKLKPIDFFEKITAGSFSEESQLAAARGTASGADQKRAGRPTPLDRGRPIFFYIDDLHLDLASLALTRKLISRFIDQAMGQNDQAAIASANGQIGFLQQLTDNKAVLRAALARLKLRPYTVRDYERPPMTEYQALLVTHGDRDTTDYFVEQTMKQTPGTSADAAASQVGMRARQLIVQGGSVTTNTLAGLEGLIKSASQLPGRKVVFFVSGGFLLDDLNSDSRYRLQKITSAAARSGTVIYSLDARGLVASLTDASSDAQPDPSGRLLRAGMGELSATQDGMNALAADTGGRATFNTNALEPGLKRALKDSSVYYLLAWKPEATDERSSKFHKIEVKLLGKPDLTVQVRRGFFDREPETASKKSAKPKPASNPASEPVTPEAQLRKAILAPYPVREIPVSLSVSYINTPGRGSLLTTTVQVPNEFFSFKPVGEKQTAHVTITGTVFDDRGNPGAAFDNHVTLEAPTVPTADGAGDLTYGYPLYVGPGLYQVRVGVRDDQTGQAGTAHGWIEIPDLTSGELVLSSLMMGVRKPPQVGNASLSTAETPSLVEFNINHRFAAQGFLRFVVFIYNAARTPPDAPPDVAVSVQVIRDGQPVVTTVQRKVSPEGINDLGRLPYAAEISLGGLPAGQYVLQLTAVDRIAKRSASQQTHFEIQ